MPDPKELRNAFSSYMTGVTVVTTVTETGIPIGFTANSFTSVSLEPPLLLVCPAKSLSCYEVFEKQKNFSVNILAEGQQDISNLFASPSDDRFANIEWHPGENGCPLLGGAAAQFNCKTHQWIDAGDHAVMIGEITSFHQHDKDGLGYSRYGYFDLAMERRAQEIQSGTSNVRVGVIIDRDGEVLLTKNAGKWELPIINVDHDLGSLNTLSRMLEKRGLEISFGPIYSIFEDQKSREYQIFYRATAKNTILPEDAEFFPLDPFLLAQFDNPAIKSMMTRYANEHENNQFGIYYGDHESGQVHLLNDNAF